LNYYNYFLRKQINTHEYEFEYFELKKSAFSLIEPPPPADDDFDVQNSKAIDESSDVDLDTRIAMLFNSKDDAPSLFNLDEEKEAKENESESELNARVKESLKIEDSNNDVDIEDGELKDCESLASSVPSPYESKETFKTNRKYLKTRKSRKRSKEKKVEKVESGASDISSSEDELLAKGSYSPPYPHPLFKNKHNKLKAIKAEDEMSLSSLSSTEPIKEEIEVPNEFKNFDATSYMYQHMGSAYQNYYYQFQQPNMQQWSYDAVHGWSSYKNENTDDPHEVAVKKVIEKLIEELKQILKKDINKRMIENTAFKKYEAWWDDQERNKNTRNVIEPEDVPVASSIPLTSLPIAALDPLSESYHPAANKGGSLGMLRNIRIQRIKREPIPVQIEEDSRKSDEDDMVHGSDSEKEDVRTSKVFMPKRKISDSSSSSDSDSDITSSEESEEEKDHVYSSDTASLISDDELTAKKTKKEKIFSSDTDSEEDEEIKELSKVSAKTKEQIYSSESEEEVKSEKLREKTPSGKNTPVHPPAESDSDFFNDDVISKPPRTPGRSSSDDQNDKSKPATPTLIMPSLPSIKEEKVKIKTPPKEDRMYSDSDEEREYQERIRRNTEWMEQIEREAKEEAEKQRILKAQMPQSSISAAIAVKEELTSTDTSRAASPINITNEPITPTSTSLPPPTPGADFNKLNQDLFLDASSKKKRGRPKGSVGKPKEKESKKVKNGAIAKAVEFVQPQNLKPDLEQQKYSLKLSPSSTSSDGGSSQASLVALEHCYSLPPSASPSTSSSPNQEAMRHDHGYYGKTDVTPLQSIQPAQLEEQTKKEVTSAAGARPVGRPRKDPNAPKAQYTKKSDKLAAAAAEKQQQKQEIKKIKAQEKIVKIDPVQHQRMVENFVPVSRYNKRAHNEEFDVLCKFLTEGIDQEDVDYMKRAYTYLIQNDIPGTELLHQVHWVDHCATDRFFEPTPVPKKRRRDDFPELRKHVTGSARTEGFYKIDSKEKAHYKYHHLKGTAAGSHFVDAARVAKMQNASREARSNQRRLLTAFGGATESDLLKFNQLKFRKKQLKFAKSAIHDWGLFAMEPIAADEMVIEYVGQMVRPSIADLRESKYEAIGIGSSYLFRIDLETIIDATKCGNLARFINHSCNVSKILKLF
jgi:histone-lysine N-methyltransferase SETD1